MDAALSASPREDGFDITVASEVMAIFCLATSISDLKERLSRIVCAYTYDGKPVTAGQIKIDVIGQLVTPQKTATMPIAAQRDGANPARLPKKKAVLLLQTRPATKLTQFSRLQRFKIF